MFSKRVAHFTDNQFARYIDASNGDIQLSEKNIIEYMQFLQDHKIERSLPWSYCPERIYNCGVYKLLGHDHFGNLVLLLKASKKDCDLYSSHEELVFSILFHDYMQKKSQKTDKTVFLIDCENVSKKNVDIARFHSNAPIVARILPDGLAKAMLIRCNWL